MNFELLKKKNYKERILSHIINSTEMEHWRWLESWTYQRLATKLIWLEFFLCSIRYSRHLHGQKHPFHFQGTFFNLCLCSMKLFCIVSISFWRKLVISDISSVFHQIKPCSHCRSINEIIVFLPVILWSPVTIRGSNSDWKTHKYEAIWALLKVFYKCVHPNLNKYSPFTHNLL